LVRGNDQVEGVAGAPRSNEAASFFGNIIGRGNIGGVARVRQEVGSQVRLFSGRWLHPDCWSTARCEAAIG
jgi:hypothetical protein